MSERVHTHNLYGGRYAGGCIACIDDYGPYRPSRSQAIADDGAPYAMVTQVGRWRYSIAIHEGLISYAPDGGWCRWGRPRAVAKARRELARYMAVQKREQFQIWPR